MLLFLSIASGVLALVWATVWISLVSPLALPSAAQWALGAFFAATYWLQPARWVARRFFHDKFWLQLLTYVLLGLMAHLFLAALGKELVLLATRLAGLERPDHARAALGAIVLAFAANLWGVRTALRGPVVREVNVPLADWPESQSGFRVVQISDLHVGPLIHRPYVEKVVEKVLGLRPDLIAVTGDLGDGVVAELGEDLSPLARLRAPHGAFYVLGNHEYYWNAQHWIEAGRSLGLEVLLNEGRLLRLPERDLWVGGVTDYAASRLLGHQSSPAAAAAGAPANATRVLLAHQPKSCFGATEAGFELLACGHTHRGQFFPVSLIVGFFNPYSHGLNRHQGKLWVYVNAGTGYWGPPLRLWVPSEITVLKLRPMRRAEERA